MYEVLTEQATTGAAKECGRQGADLHERKIGITPFDSPVIIDPLWLPADIEHITWPSTVATDLQKRWFAQR